MKKTINFIGIGLSLILIILSYYYLQEIEKSKVGVAPLLALFVNDSDQLTIQVGQYSLFIFIAVLFLFVKNITFQKKISILGIIITSLIIVWDLIMLNSPSHISFDEVGLAWMAYGVINIILFTLLIRKKKNNSFIESDEVIDDLLI